MAATVNVVVPLPVPFVPPVSVIHVLPLDDDQKQLAAAVIDTDPLPPFASKLNEPGDVVYVHGVTVTVAVALSIEPQPFVMRTQ